jgi:hypothetical protein
MAVYQGARRAALLGLLRDSTPGRTGPTAPTSARPLARRRARTAVRAGRRANRVGLVLGGIVLAFLLAFFSLAQTIRVSATGYDLAGIQSERERLEATRLDLVTDINRLGSGPAIRKQALDDGLSQLAAPLIVPAR